MRGHGVRLRPRHANVQAYLATRIRTTRKSLFSARAVSMFFFHFWSSTTYASRSIKTKNIYRHGVGLDRDVSVEISYGKLNHMCWRLKRCSESF